MREMKMIPLPSSCEGCTFYKYKDAPGNGFVPDRVVQGSTVYFLAQNPGKDEIEGRKLIRRMYGEGVAEYASVYPEPLIGATGVAFNTKFLPLAGLKREDVSLGNAIRCRPALGMKAAGLKGVDKADDLPTITATMRLEKSKADIVNAMKHCRSVHMHIPESTKVVVTLGRHAMFAMTGLAKDQDEYKKKQGVLESWRGYGVICADRDSICTVNTNNYHDVNILRSTGLIVFFTMHIAALNYGENRKFTHATMQDFYKLGRLLRGEWPLSVPTWSTAPPQVWPSYASFDTEYNPNTTELYRWSMCDTDNNLYAIESGDIPAGVFHPTEQKYTVLIQNALADIKYLSRLIPISNVKIEDMMLAHSVLWPGELHGLNYINSLYGTLNRYKHLSEGSPVAYSAWDAWEPMQMWRSYFIPEFKRDRESWMVYKKYRLPLIAIIDKAQRSGAKVDTERLSDVQFILHERLERYKARAKEITGDDSFHLGGSKRLKEEIYG
jgi:uracil-DNA glycosylase